MIIQTFFEDQARGGDIVFPINFRADDGETMEGITIEADLRFAGYKPSALTPEMPKVGSFVIEEQSDEAGWFLIIPDAQTLELDDGYYVTDVRYTVGEITRNGKPAAFKLYTPVSRGIA